MLSKKKQVFIVDDDESVCRALKILLMTFDFDVKVFHSAKDFFDAVPNEVAGCLVLDIRIPQTDGWVMQKQIFDSGSKRPVIFISAEKHEKAAERALKAGAIGYLQKPVNGHDLVDLINLAYKNDDNQDITNTR